MTVVAHTVLATAKGPRGQRERSVRDVHGSAVDLRRFLPTGRNGRAVNTVKGGSTVALMFEAFADERELVDTAAVNQPLMATQAVCDSADTNDIELLATGGTSLRYDATTGPNPAHRARARGSLQHKQMVGRSGCPAEGVAKMLIRIRSFPFDNATQRTAWMRICQVQVWRARGDRG